MLPIVANRPIIPIYVLGVEVGNVGLRAAQIPTKFVKAAALSIPLAGDYFDMLLVLDRSLLSGFDPGPRFGREDRPG